jgi:hypothetical protein
MGSKIPVSRKNDLVIQEHDGELLIYDLSKNKALCLNETSAKIWSACDGSRTVADLAAAFGGEDLVWLALHDLKKNRLLEGTSEIPGRFEGMSRREVIRKIGIGSMVAIPVIASLVAPTAVHAASCSAPTNRDPGCPCAMNSDCLSNMCSVSNTCS